MSISAATRVFLGRVDHYENRSTYIPHLGKLGYHPTPTEAISAVKQITARRFIKFNSMQNEASVAISANEPATLLTGDKSKHKFLER